MIYQKLTPEEQEHMIAKVDEIGCFMPPHWAVAAFGGDPIKRKAVAAEYVRLGKEVHGASHEDWLEVLLREKAFAELLNLWTADLEECLKS